MKKVIFLLLLFLFSFLRNNVHSQCITDVYYIDVPNQPCFFVMEGWGCFDPFTYPNAFYTWNIIDPVTNTVVYTSFDPVNPQSSPSFFQQLELFGGYIFELRIDQDKDGNVDVVESVAYTTCQTCAGSSVNIDFIDCSNGDNQGCKVRISGSIDAINGEGVSETGRVVISYLGNGFENCGNMEVTEVVYDEVPITFQPSSQTNVPGQLVIAEEFVIPLSRGCHQATVIYEIEDGAHQSVGTACTELSLVSDPFRCVFNCTQSPSEEFCAIIEAGDCCAAYSCVYGFLYPNNDPESECCDGFEGFTSGGNGHMLVSSSSGSNGFGVYPNPATNQLQVRFPKMDFTGFFVAIFDLNGRLIKQEPLEGRPYSMTFDISGIAPGTYFITVKNEKEQLYKEKVVVVK